MSDLGAAASGAASGAKMGATLGSVIPGIGNVVGGIAGAVLGGLGGIFSSGEARKARKRQRKRLSNQQTRLRGQIPGIQAYFDELQSYKKGQIARKKGKAVEQFVESTVGTIPTLRRKIAATGLQSGSADKLIGSTSAKLQTSISNTMGDIADQESDMELAMDQQRQNQLQGVIDQISTLQTKKDNL
jgi:hypothetical protein